MSTALYRRYRPESFADVIGQEHVTEPLMQALRSGRVNHAYLFSGPRGCGKTTSARILARCLNCEEGPTETPCGTCASCVALARDGAGSVDVIEIDAASHGRVDDTRELRERAAFGPATSRYKIYIIDEAHMVSREGFNSLLKIVEEPPEHVMFIFATTEPEKVLATIRSRTHHYPFHLVPPARLTEYLETLCEQEGVNLEPGVLSFVTRAGAGSVRDSLSVLDQLISGAGEEGLTYERTAALLGFTDVELLDAVVEAVAAGDAATVFQQVDRVMESGHDPRRFVEDLLERYRDLIVLAAVGDRAGGLLPGLPEDQIDRMRMQAGSYGAAGLSRAADLVAEGLADMAGAVSYRLMLELLAARLLLPAADGEDGYGARLDRIERRLGAGPAPESAAAAPSRPASSRPAPTSGPSTPASPAATPTPAPQPTDRSQEKPRNPAPAAEEPAAPSREPEQQPAPGTLDTAALRRHWPDIIEAVRGISRRTAGALESIQVVDYDGSRLLVGMPDQNWIRHFMGASHEEALRQGVLDALALDVRIEATTLEHGGDRPGQQAGPRPAQQQRQQEQQEPAHRNGSDQDPRRRPEASQQESSRSPRSGPPTAPSGPRAEQPPAEEPPPAEPPEEDDWSAYATPTDADRPSRGDDAAETPAAPRVAAVPDELPRGQLRSRGSSGAPSRATEDAATPTPTMAEQLGAVPGRAPATGEGWGATAGGSAPGWATGGGAPGGTGPSAADGDPTPDRPDRQEASTPTPTRDDSAAAPSDDDEDLATSGAVGQPVVERVLGGTVIAINDEPV